MKFAVMGAGALGCYFGGRLAQAGFETALVARGPHLEALKRDGLFIESPLGDAHIENVTATDDPADIGPVETILFLVKLYDTESAARQMAPLIGPDTSVLSFQNGIEGWERIGEIVGMERVIAGTAFIPADIRAPGIVRHNGPFARLTIGEFTGEVTQRCTSLRDAFTGAGVEITVVDDIQIRIWEKFIVLSALSAITTLTRLPLGAILNDPLCTDLFTAAIMETYMVGKAAHPDLPETSVETALERVHGFPKHMRASMLDDLERGKKLELDDLSGAVVRLGEKYGVETPVHRTTLQALHPYIDGESAD